MNEEPGHIVRPVVRSGVPVKALPRKLPYNARHMPVGVSANTLGVVPGRVNMRRLLFIGIPLVLLLSVSLGTWLLARNLSPLGQKVISNDIYDYHFLFYKAAEQVNLAQGHGLQYDNHVVAIARPSRDNTIQECGVIGSGWHRAFMVTLEGREQQVCTLNNRAYLIIFYHGDVRHLFELTYTSRQPDSRNKEIQKIIESVTVTIP